MSIRPSLQFTENDMGVVLRFNYSAIRETFEVNRQISKKLYDAYTNIGKRPDPKTCLNGEWWNDRDNSFFYVCVSGKNTATYEQIEVNPVICTGAACLTGINYVPKETFLRKWSNAT